MKLPSSTIWYYKIMLKIRVIDWQSYPSCDTLFSRYSMIRHYGFYPKLMICHNVIHPTIKVDKIPAGHLCERYADVLQQLCQSIPYKEHKIANTIFYEYSWPFRRNITVIWKKISLLCFVCFYLSMFVWFFL